MRVALITMNSSDDPHENLADMSRWIEEAADRGADFILTPEVTNCLSSSSQHQTATLATETADVFLASTQELAKKRKVWVLLGSLALASDDEDKRFHNRSILIGPDGGITARYDKIHMFDVDVGDGQTYRESSGYQPGHDAVCADVAGVKIGMSICYDLRFPQLYRDLAQAGAKVLTVPAAFTRTTGLAHWHVLLRARAIETGSFVLAPAQTGTHREKSGPGRQTFGHSLVVSPWGEIVCDAGENVGVVCADIDLSQVDDARRRIPSLLHDRVYGEPR